MLRTSKRRLQIRRVVALTGIIHEAQRSNALEPAIVQTIREELTRSTERLDALLSNDAERAHAALFTALSLELDGSDSEKKRRRGNRPANFMTNRQYRKTGNATRIVFNSLS